MNLEQEILSVLVQAGSKGLKLEKIARHVYNSGNSIFHPLDYKMVYNFVSQYLMKNSKDPRSLGGKWRCIRIMYDRFMFEA